MRLNETKLLFRGEKSRKMRKKGLKNGQKDFGTPLDSGRFLNLSVSFCMRLCNVSYIIHLNFYKMIKPNYKSKGATELLNYAEHILKKKIVSARKERKKATFPTLLPSFQAHFCVHLG